jgi:hypothetical protein
MNDYTINTINAKVSLLSILIGILFININHNVTAAFAFAYGLVHMASVLYNVIKNRDSKESSSYTD